MVVQFQCPHCFKFISQQTINNLLESSQQPKSLPSKQQNPIFQSKIQQIWTNPLNNSKIQNPDHSQVQNHENETIITFLKDLSLQPQTTTALKSQHKLQTQIQNVNRYIITLIQQGLIKEEHQHNFRQKGFNSIKQLSQFYSKIQKDVFGLCFDEKQSTLESKKNPTNSSKATSQALLLIGSELIKLKAIIKKINPSKTWQTPFERNLFNGIHESKVNDQTSILLVKDIKNISSEKYKIRQEQLSNCLKQFTRTQIILCLSKTDFDPIKEINGFFQNMAKVINLIDINKFRDSIRIILIDQLTFTQFKNHLSYLQNLVTDQNFLKSRLYQKSFLVLLQIIQQELQRLQQCDPQKKNIEILNIQNHSFKDLLSQVESSKFTLHSSEQVNFELCQSKHHPIQNYSMGLERILQQSLENMDFQLVSQTIQSMKIVKVLFNRDNQLLRTITLIQKFTQQKFSIICQLDNYLHSEQQNQSIVRRIKEFLYFSSKYEQNLFKGKNDMMLEFQNRIDQILRKLQSQMVPFSKITHKSIKMLLKYLKLIKQFRPKQFSIVLSRIVKEKNIIRQHFRDLLRSLNKKNKYIKYTTNEAKQLINLPCHHLMTQRDSQLKTFEQIVSQYLAQTLETFLRKKVEIFNPFNTQWIIFFEDLIYNLKKIELINHTSPSFTVHTSDYLDEISNLTKTIKRECQDTLLMKIRSFSLSQNVVYQFRHYQQVFLQILKTIKSLPDIKSSISIEYKAYICFQKLLKVWRDKLQQFEKIILTSLLIENDLNKINRLSSNFAQFVKYIDQTLSIVNIHQIQIEDQFLKRQIDSNIFQFKQLVQKILKRILQALTPSNESNKPKTSKVIILTQKLLIFQNLKYCFKTCIYSYNENENRQSNQKIIDSKHKIIVTALTFPFQQLMENIQTKTKSLQELKNVFDTILEHFDYGQHLHQISKKFPIFDSTFNFKQNQSIKFAVRFIVDSFRNFSKRIPEIHNYFVYLDKIKSLAIDQRRILQQTQKHKKIISDIEQFRLQKVCQYICLKQKVNIELKKFGFEQIQAYFTQTFRENNLTQKIMIRLKDLSKQIGVGLHQSTKNYSDFLKKQFEILKELSLLMNSQVKISNIQNPRGTINNRQEYKNEINSDNISKQTILCINHKPTFAEMSIQKMEIIKIQVMEEISNFKREKDDNSYKKQLFILVNILTLLTYFRSLKQLICLKQFKFYGELTFRQQQKIAQFTIYFQELQVELNNQLSGACHKVESLIKENDKRLGCENLQADLEILENILKTEQNQNVNFTLSFLMEKIQQLEHDIFETERLSQLQNFNESLISKQDINLVIPELNL